MNLVASLEQCAEFLSECPHPDKAAFRSAAKARKRAREIGGLKHYKCVCGQWHMTTDLDRGDYWAYECYRFVDVSDMY